MVLVAYGTYGLFIFLHGSGRGFVMTCWIAMVLSLKPAKGGKIPTGLSFPTSPRLCLDTGKCNSEDVFLKV